ncbi:hypothetical protein GCM10010156_49190 [Planobispora rosea]|uniref:DNA transporter n=1 Tax=Planobispora rosea TaxID=35762 RepID=A0A8J3S419_PLARO|nr:LOG family protein [Planobispora rosea]GGS84713.1 hypothetical protein GCM10010156_49190 [Planobispora rosea]GIH86430.1 hypothetical protein Pro02_48380 [Planobispora rosea]
MSSFSRRAAFFGGVIPGAGEEDLARAAGAILARAGYQLLHGGYNGAMEAAAAGAAAHGAPITAITLAGKAEWGPLNPYVTATFYASDQGSRLNAFLEHTDLVIAMGGGVGTLHELTAALWYAGNIRSIPVWLLGPSACRLEAFLRTEHWLIETPTRPLGFLRTVPDAGALEADLAALTTSQRWR